MTGIDRDAIRAASQISNIKEIPNPLKEELAQLRQDFEDYRCKQAAEKAAEEKRHELAEKRQFWRGALAGAIGSTTANLFIFYWPNMVSFLKAVFH